jgi:hypothetical protein
MDAKSIVRILIVLAIIGLTCWLILWAIPIPYPIDRIIIAVAVLLSVLFIVRETGLA